MMFIQAAIRNAIQYDLRNKNNKIKQKHKR